MVILKGTFFWAVFFSNVFFAFSPLGIFQIENPFIPINPFKCYTLAPLRVPAVLKWKGIHKKIIHLKWYDKVNLKQSQCCLKVTDDVFFSRPSVPALCHHWPQFSPPPPSSPSRHTEEGVRLTCNKVTFCKLLRWEVSGLEIYWVDDFELENARTKRYSQTGKRTAVWDPPLPVWTAALLCEQLSVWGQHFIHCDFEAFCFSFFVPARRQQQTEWESFKLSSKVCMCLQSHDLFSPVCLCLCACVSLCPSCVSMDSPSAGRSNSTPTSCQGPLPPPWTRNACLRWVLLSCHLLHN